MTITDWLSQLVDWLRSHLGTASAADPPYLERILSDNQAVELLLLADSTCSELPGLCSLWLVNHAAAPRDLILILANIAQMKEVSSLSPPASEIGELRRAFEIHARQELLKQRHINGSHLFMVGWRSKSPDRVRYVDAKAQRFRSIDAQHCFVVNLQSGMSGWMGQNYYAERVTRAIGLRLLRLPEQPYGWDVAAGHVDWLQYLKFFACEFPHTKLPEEGHVLQPPRSR